VKDEFYTKLGIYSMILKPDEIDSLLGLSCDKSYIKDEHRGHSKIQEKENGWIIYSQISRELPLNLHIENLLKRISSFSDKVREIAGYQETEVEFSCIIHAKEEPPLFFTKEQVSILAAIGASIDIDIYYWQRE
jgi:hypothetical protein